VRAEGIHRPYGARLLTSSPIGGLTGTVRFDWAALDAWFEEDEQVFAHPRNPYVRVDFAVDSFDDVIYRFSQ